MAAILDLANTPALSDSRLGIHRKSKEYNLFYICAKLCSFGRNCPKISLTAPTNSQTVIVTKAYTILALTE